MSELRDALVELIRANFPIVNKQGTVKAIAVGKKSCTITPTDGSADMEEVFLLASLSDTENYMLAVPAVGSNVIYSQIGIEKAYCFISKMEEIDEIIINVKAGFKCHLNGNQLAFNDGKLGGLPVVDKIVERLNRLEKRMNTHQHISAAPGSITAVDPASNAPLIPTIIKDLENPNIKQ